MTLTDAVHRAPETKVAILVHIDRILAAAPANAPAGLRELLSVARRILGAINSAEWWAMYGGDGSEAVARRLINSVGTQIKAGTWQTPR
jgi:hypothetical protein